MTDYFVSNTYKNWERIGSPYEKNGKLYTKAKCTCDRCVKGVYVCRVENNQPVPHPAYGGVCLKCGGTGYLTKEIRLYTEKEFKQKETAAAKQKEKKAAELEAKMKAEFANNKAKWLEKNGFNAEGETFVVTGDSYSIKEQLKEAGFHFDLVLLWHRNNPEGYEDRVVKINAEDIIEFSAWGEGHYLETAQKYVKTMISPEDEVPSEWIGEIGNKINRVLVTLTRKSGFYGKWGYSNLYQFKDENGNVITWFTTKEIDFEVDDKIYLTGNVKSHDTYRDTKQTVVSRCKLETIS